MGESSEIRVPLIEEIERWDSISLGIMQRDFVFRLPQKIKDCLNPQIPFQIDASKSENLIPGEKEYYDKQFAALRSFEEVDSVNTSNEINEDEINLEEERNSELELLIKISNYANIVILALKIHAMLISGSIAIGASTLDSLLSLMAGIMLWFTYLSIKNINILKGPIGKLRAQPVELIIFTVVIAILGYQALVQSLERLIDNETPQKMNSAQLAWFYSIMLIITIIKLVIWIYSKNSKNKTVHAFSEDHYFDVVINMFSWAIAVLGDEFYSSIDPIGALIIAIYTIFNWSKIIWKTAVSLIGQSAPPEMLQKLIYIVIKHNSQIIRVDKLRSYTFGILHLVEVDAQVHEDLPFKDVHAIEESLRLQIEKLPEVERAFVHLHSESHHYNMVNIEVTEDLPVDETCAIEEPMQVKIEKIPEGEGKYVHLNSDSNYYDRVLNDPFKMDEQVPKDLSLKETSKIKEKLRVKNEEHQEIETDFVRTNFESDNKQENSIITEFCNNMVNTEVTEDLPVDETSAIEEPMQVKIEKIPEGEGTYAYLNSDSNHYHKVDEQVPEDLSPKEIITRKEKPHVKTEVLQEIETEFVCNNFESDNKQENSIITEFSNNRSEEPSQAHSNMVNIEVTEDLPVETTRVIEKLVQVNIEKIPEVEGLPVHFNSESDYYDRVEEQVHEDLSPKEITSKEKAQVKTEVLQEIETQFVHNNFESNNKQENSTITQFSNNRPEEPSQAHSNMVNIEVTEDLLVEKTRVIEEPVQVNIERIPEGEGTPVHFNSESDYYDRVEEQVPEDLSPKEIITSKEKPQVKTEVLQEIETEFVHNNFESHNKQENSIIIVFSNNRQEEPSRAHSNMVDIEVKEDLPVEKTRVIEEPVQVNIEKIPEGEGTPVHFNSESDYYDRVEEQVPEVLQEREFVHNNYESDNIQENSVITEFSNNRPEKPSWAHSNMVDIEVTEDLLAEKTRVIEEPVQVNIKKIPEGEGTPVHFNFESDYYDMVDEQVPEDLPQKEILTSKEKLQIKTEVLQEIETKFIRSNFESDNKQENSIITKFSNNRPEEPSQAHSNMMNIEVTEDLPVEKTRVIEEPVQVNIEKIPEGEGTSVHLNSDSDYYDRVDEQVPDDLSLKENIIIEEKLEVKSEVLREVETEFVHINIESGYKPEHSIISQPCNNGSEELLLL